MARYEAPRRRHSDKGNDDHPAVSSSRADLQLHKIQPRGNHVAALALNARVLGATPMRRLARTPHSLATSTHTKPPPVHDGGGFCVLKGVAGLQPNKSPGRC